MYIYSIKESVRFTWIGIFRSIRNDMMKYILVDFVVEHFLVVIVLETSRFIITQIYGSIFKIRI